MSKRKCIAEYDYEPQEEGELGFFEGDLIEIIEKNEDGWWLGRIDDTEGLLPNNYVRMIDSDGEDDTDSDDSREARESSPVSENSKDSESYDNGFSSPGNNSDIDAISISGKKYVAEFDFEEASVDELSFSAGDIIHLIGEIGPDGWAHGRIGKRKGIFPSNYVRAVDSEEDSSDGDNEMHEDENKRSSDTEEVGTSPRRSVIFSSANTALKKLPSWKGVALFDYESQGNDEMTFKVGDEILLMGDPEDDWRYGKIGDMEGFIPSNYVKLLGIKESTDDDSSEAHEEEDESDSDQESAEEVGHTAPCSAIQLYANKSLKRKTCRKAVAQFDFEAESESELSMHEGDVIELLEDDDEGNGWFYGRNGKREGYFPSTYVEIILDNDNESEDQSEKDSGTSSRPPASELLSPFGPEKAKSIGNPTNVTRRTMKGDPDRFKESKTENKTSYICYSIPPLTDRIEPFFSGPCAKHTFILLHRNNERIVFGFGNNKHGQLGIQHSSKTEEGVGIPFFAGQTVSFIACGTSHTLVLLAGGELFGFGKNKQGQLGLGSDGSDVLYPSRNYFFEGKTIVCISCGSSSSFCVLNDGKVFAFGNNEFGQLGVESIKNANSPVVVEFPGNPRIVSICSGKWHGVALDENGALYTWGESGHHRLGKSKLRRPPKMFDLTTSSGRIERIYAGKHSTYAVASRTEIYMWELPMPSGGIHRKHNTQNEPKRLTLYDVNPIKWIRVGGHHAHIMVECENRFRLTGMGDNSLGMLFIGHSSPHSVMGKHPPTFSKLKNVNSLIDIVCGKKHAVLIYSEERFFGVGDAEALGNVSQTSSRDRFLPPMHSTVNFLVNSSTKQFQSNAPADILKYARDAQKAAGALHYTNCIIDVATTMGSAFMHYHGAFFEKRCCIMSGINPIYAVAHVSAFSEQMALFYIDFLYGGEEGVKSSKSLTLEEIVSLHKFLSTYHELDSGLRVFLRKSMKKEFFADEKSISVPLFFAADDIGDDMLCTMALSEITKNVEQSLAIARSLGGLRMEAHMRSAIGGYNKYPTLVEDSSDYMAFPSPSEVMVLLHREKDMCGDVELTCVDAIVRAHKFVLAARSDFFKDILSSDPDAPVMNIGISVRQEPLQRYLEYLYLGEIDFEKDGSPELLALLTHILREENDEELKMLNACKIAIS